jgi:lysozyme family protein
LDFISGHEALRKSPKLSQREKKMAASNWKQAFEQMLASEGGFTDDERDKGNQLPDGRKGSTMLGVTQFNWENHIGHQVTHEQMKKLTPADVEPLYKKKYWDVVRADELPSGIDYLVFDMGVNAGPGRSIKLLQTAVGVPADGGLGPISMKAVLAADPVELIEKFSQAKEDFYRGLDDFKVYGTGWLNRVAAVKIKASSMLG